VTAPLVRGPTHPGLTACLVLAVGSDPIRLTEPLIERMAIEQVAFVFGASSGLTQGLHFPGADLGELGKQDPYLGDQLGELITACLSPGRWVRTRISGL